MTERVLLEAGVNLTVFSPLFSVKSASTSYANNHAQIEPF